MTGDQGAFTALDMESKLLLAYSIGKRNGKTAFALMEQLADRIEGAPEISSDAFSAFVNAIDDAFNGDVFASFASLRETPTAPESPPRRPESAPQPHRPCSRRRKAS